MGEQRQNNTRHWVRAVVSCTRRTGVSQRSVVKRQGLLLRGGGGGDCTANSDSIALESFLKTAEIDSSVILILAAISRISARNFVLPRASIGGKEASG